MFNYRIGQGNENQNQHFEDHINLQSLIAVAGIGGMGSSAFAMLTVVGGLCAFKYAIKAGRFISSCCFHNHQEQLHHENPAPRPCAHLN